MSTRTKARTRACWVSTVMGAVLAVAGTAAWAGSIAGSKHDFSTLSWSGGQICVACHTPHGGNTTVTDAPLWNHTNSTATYTLYSSATMNAGALTQPSGVSKLCLSCHDGTVALDSFGGAAGTPSNVMTGSEAVAAAAQGSLANDHPIGFVYDTALATADGALYDPATRSVTVGAGGSRSKTGSVASLMLFNGRLECASCHDVHNTFTANDGAVSTGGYPLLRVSKSASTICLTCHNK